MSAQDRHDDEALRFIVELGKSAHQCGSSNSRLEAYLTRLARVLGYRGTVRATPSEILFAFDRREGRNQWIRFESVPPPGFNLNRIAALQEVGNLVESHEIPIADGTRRVHDIASLPDPWGSGAVATSMLVAGAGFATMIGGGVWDVLAGGTLGVVVFLARGLLGRFQGPRTALWTSFLVALLVGFLVALARLAEPQINPIVTSVCALVILVPGYPISIGVLEIFSNHVVSGLANLANGLLALAQLVAGAWLGYWVGAQVLSVPAVRPGEAVGLAWLLVALVPMLAALCCAMQASRKDTPATMIVVGTCFLVNFLVSAAIPGMLGVFAAASSAMALGAVLGTLWNRRTGRPMTVMTAQLAMLLTCGTIGFRGLAATASGQSSLGGQQLQQMFVVAVALGVGLLVGYSIVPPRESL